VANTKTSDGTHHVLIDPPPSANNKRVDIAIIKMMQQNDDAGANESLPPELRENRLKICWYHSV
jgi:hypothetical protein